MILLHGNTSGVEDGCQYSLESIDLRPPVICLNITECEIEWPCELREFWHQIHPLVDVTRGFLSIGTVFFCLLGVILNGISFYVLISSGLAKNGSGIYLLALAVCDCLNLVLNYAIGVARGEIEEFNNYFQRDEWLCRWHGVFVDIFQLISAWIVVSFTVERCIAVWYPLRIRSSSKKRSRVVVATCSIVLGIFSLSKIFLVGFEKDSVFGYQACTSSRYVWEGMAYLRVAFQTWIPTFLVALFNLLMFWKLKTVRRNRNRLTAHRTNEEAEYQNREGASNSKRGSSNQTTPMLIAVSLAYLTLVLPLGAVQTVELYWGIRHRVSMSDVEPRKTEYISWMRTKLLLKFIRSFFFGLYQINFAINFFLYCAAGVQFRTFLFSKLKTLRNRLKHRFCFCRKLVPVRTNTTGGISTKTVTSELDTGI